MDEFVNLWTLDTGKQKNYFTIAPRGHAVFRELQVLATRQACQNIWLLSEEHVSSGTAALNSAACPEYHLVSGPRDAARKRQKPSCEALSPGQQPFHRRSHDRSEWLPVLCAHSSTVFQRLLFPAVKLLHFRVTGNYSDSELQGLQRIAGLADREYPGASQ